MAEEATEITRAEHVLQAALTKELQDCVVIGFLPTGEPFLTSTSTDLSQINWFLDIAKQVVIENAREPRDQGQMQ